MSTIKLTADMTKNEFRAAFTENFEYIYLRVKSSKGLKKLSDSKFFTEGSEINIDSDITVEQFEKEATSKTGMEVSVYYETKAKGEKSKFYLARKEDKETSLADLEEKASKMENIFSQKDYMEKLAAKKISKKSIKDISKQNNNVGTTFTWAVSYEISDEEDFEFYHNELPARFKELLNNNFGLIDVKMVSPKDDNIIPFDTGKELYTSEEYGLDCSLDSHPIVFEIENKACAMDIAKILYFDLQSTDGGDVNHEFIVTVLKDENGDVYRYGWYEDMYCYGWDEDEGYWFREEF